MFDKLLKNALDTGAEVIVETRFCGDALRGRVLDFDGEGFTIFHSGTGGGVLWAFKLADVAYCGLIVERPELPEVLDAFKKVVSAAQQVSNTAKPKPSVNDSH
ncbi:MAG: hypothetical protein VKJ06_07505 [Vampirovibrionales bacterium]|nr:hypothetical protein [Vampirovibrionales bacterium]